MSKPSVLLGVWTLFIWGSRIRNIVRADGWVASGAMAAAVMFTVLGLTLVVLTVRSGPADEAAVWSDAGGRLGVGLASLGILWWVVRDLLILFADHSVAFKLVHTVLAVITVILSGWVIRSWLHRGRPKPVTSASYG